MNMALKIYWNSNPIPLDEKIKDSEMAIEIPLGALIPSPTASSPVRSVNGKIGDVVLDSIDVDAEPLGSVAALRVYVEEQDALKADITYVDAQDSLKADKSYVDQQLGDLATSVGAKANKVYVDQQDALLQDQIDGKADWQAVNQVLQTKADLDSSGKVPASQLPSFVDDVLDGRYVNPTLINDLDGNPYTPESGKIYVDVDTNKTYRWSGMLYVMIGGGGVALGETSETAYRGDRGKIAYDHSQSQGNPHNSTTSDIPEGNRLYFTDVRVRNSNLTGLVLLNSPVVESDSVLSAFGKLQGQLSDLSLPILNQTLNGFTVGANSAITAADTVLSAFRKTQGQINAINTNLPANVRATVLTGLNVSDSSNVVATDTVLAGIGKLQSKFTNIQDTVRGTNLLGLTTGSALVITSSDSILTALGKLQGQLTQTAVPNWLDSGFVSTVHSSLTNVDIQFARWGGLLWIRGSFRVSAAIAQGTQLITLTTTQYKFKSERADTPTAARNNFQIPLHCDDGTVKYMQVVTDGLLRNNTEAGTSQHFDVATAGGLTAADGFVYLEPQPLGKIVN